MIMLPSHSCEFCLRNNTNWHSLRIAQHRIDSNYFVLIRCHFLMSLQVNTNVLKCSSHSYWPCESKPIRIASYCIAERRINSCQFLLVRISSLYIRIDSLFIRTGICRLSDATQFTLQYDAQGSHICVTGSEWVNCMNTRHIIEAAWLFRRL